MVSHKDPLCSRNIIAFEWQVQIMAIKGLFKVKLPPTACSSSLVIISPISLLAFMEFIQYSDHETRVDILDLKAFCLRKGIEITAL